MCPYWNNKIAVKNNLKTSKKPEKRHVYYHTLYNIWFWLVRTAINAILKISSQSLIILSHWVTAHCSFCMIFWLNNCINMFQLPSSGKMGRATLIAGTGSIRACAHALGSIPLGLASACSHSAPVSRGLYAVNTPPWCHGTINPRLLGITAQFSHLPETNWIQKHCEKAFA